MLEDLDSALLGRPGETRRELAGVHKGVRVGLEHRTEIGGRADGVLDLRAIEPDGRPILIAGSLYLAGEVLRANDQIPR